MTTVELRPPSRGSLLPVGLIVTGVATLAAATLAGRGVVPIAGLLVLVSVLSVGYRTALRWDVLVGFLLVVVLVIPIKRYGFAVSLPFDLEPYRVLIAILLAFWIAALLVDSDVRLRGSAVDGPLLLFALAVTASIALNPGSITSFDVLRSLAGPGTTDTIRGLEAIRIVDVSEDVAKALLFLVSFYLAFYFIVSVARSPRAIHIVLKTLVLGAAGVAVFAIVERRTNYNVFDHLEGWVPLVNFEGGLPEEGIVRGGRQRVYGSAQHPIALAALLVMVVPLSLYLAHQTRRRIWYAAAAALTLGALATVSRTSVTMLAVVGIVFLSLRPAIMKPVLVLLVPALLVVHLAIPGTIGSLRQAFFPSEGLIADQTVYGGRISGERLAPQIDAIQQQPAFGQGYGTRVTSGREANARILDNQWLGTAVETGLVGVFAWLWLFVRFLRRAGSEAKRDQSGRGWLLAALAASVAAFAVGMLTFDAFSFIQATFVLFVVLALGSSTLAWRGAWPSETAAAATRPR